MAKKNVEETVECFKMSEKLKKDMIKKYGQIFRSGSDIIEENKNRIYIPISPAHDSNTGGGIKEGSFLGLSGMPGTGKTTTALQLIRNAQRPEFGSRKTFYGDIESRLDQRNIDGVSGLDGSQEMMTVFRPTEQAINAEDSLTVIEDTIRQNEKMIIVIDSVSTLISKSELEDEISGQNRSLLPKILKNFIRRNAIPVQAKGHIVVCIMHQMADMSMSRKTKTMDGGNGIQFQCDNILEIKYVTPWLDSENKRIGQFCNWEIIKSSGAGLTGAQYESALRYGYGIDDIHEIIGAAMELGIITKGGSWYKADFLPETGKEGKRQVQGQDKVASFLRDNPKIVDDIKVKLQEILLC